MKKFIISVLSVAVFFVGLGSLVEQAGAKFKSDEKSLAIIARARQAVGGDAAIAEVRGMVIKGQTTHSIKIDGVEKTQTGETEIAMQLPDKLMKMIKIGSGTGTGEPMIDKQVDVIVLGDAKEPAKIKTNGDGKDQMKVMINVEDSGSGPVKKITIKKADGTVQELTGAEADKFIAEHNTSGADKKIIIKKHDGTITEKGDGTAHKVFVHKTGDGGATFTTEDGKTIKLDDKTVHFRAAGDHGGVRQNEMLRTTLSLLLTAPQGIDVEYTYAGETSVDGTQCDIVNAAFAGSSFKLFISRTSSLPIAMAYTGHRMPKVMRMKQAAPGDTPKEKDVMVFTKKIDGPADTAEFMVKFSDYRLTSGVQLPYRWTTTVADKLEDTFDVTSYEINPANIADRFKDQKVLVRTKKPDSL